MPQGLQEPGRVGGTLPTYGLEAVNALVCATRHPYGKERGLKLKQE